MSRVSEVIEQANIDRAGALIGYLPACFPDLATSAEAAIAMVRSGVDIIELGIPYSDPVMDGPVIQEATQIALAGGFRIADLFRLIELIRAQVDAPILVMTYWNPVVQYGPERFALELQRAGGDGLITPDITPDSAEDWIRISESTGLERVFLAAPSSSDERLRMISEKSTGFVYTVSTMGITGERAELDAAARNLTERLYAAGAGIACVGIGISSAQHVATTLEYADGAIVGTVFVRSLRDGGVEGLARTVSELAAGTARTPGSASPRR